MSDVAGISHVGRVRKENQDAFLAEAFKRASSLEVLCLAIADGMGGHQRGKLASERAIQVVRSRLAESETDPSSELCVSIVQEAHSFVGRLAKEGETVGTTLTLVLTLGREAFIAHVGDSRAYRLRDGRLIQITEDQVWDERSDFGLQLRQAVGVGDRIEPDALHIRLEDGDWLLVCSDGLHKFVPQEVLETSLNKASEPKAACEQLLNLALGAGGRDNIAVVLARIGESTEGSPRTRRVPAQAWAVIVVVAVVLALALFQYLRNGGSR